jgi:hypothetical protein
VGWAKARVKTKDGVKLCEQIVGELDDLFVRWERHDFLLYKNIVAPESGPQ